MSKVPTSNMASKRYCPKCKNFNLKRIHRGYFKKKILKQPVQYKCHECNEHVSDVVIENNEMLKVPVFISSS